MFTQVNLTLRLGLNFNFDLMNKAKTLTKTTFVVLAAFQILFAACSGPQQESAGAKEMVIWYNKPADKVWLDGLFIGNGYMGANVFGRVYNERIALNE